MQARRQEDFTANFAHELKTPMTSIIGYADTLYQKTLPPEDVHQLAGIIMNEGMRLGRLFHLKLMGTGHVVAVQIFSWKRHGLMKSWQMRWRLSRRQQKNERSR